MKKKFNYKQTGKLAGILLAGFFLGWLLFGGSSGQKEADIDQHVEDTHTDEEGNTVYTCSMHPQIRQNEPGDCPICGMELIPADQAEAQDETTFTMTESAVKLAEIQTSAVERGIPDREARLPGRVAADERRVSSITAQFPGRIEELYVDFTGTYVQKGEKLATVYSPELISAQQELLEAAKNKEANPGLYESTRRKLQLWGLAESEIQRIESSGEITDALPIVAARSGYVTQKNIDTKDYIDEGTVMYKVADFSSLWVLFDAYETDIGAIDQGDSIDFTVRSYPGQTFEAEITYVDPFIDPESRTARVRAEVENPEEQLKPDMLARGIVTGTSGDGEKLMVPQSAVMWTGKRSIVFVEQESSEVPTFEPRLVTLGHRAGDYYVIEEGLEEGEQVVTHGNFKLDSAAQLADKLSMMNREPGSGSVPTHDHSEMESGEEMKMDAEDQSSSSSAGIPKAFREDLNELVDHYLAISEALEQDEPEQAMALANEFRESLEAIDMSAIKNDNKMEDWMNRQQDLSADIAALTEANGDEGFREQFAELSESLQETINRFDIERPLYLQHCPMAKDGEGAFWISDAKSISNPYMGQEMPDCGTTEEQLSDG